MAAVRAEPVKASSVRKVVATKGGGALRVGFPLLVMAGAGRVVTVEPIQFSASGGIKALVPPDGLERFETVRAPAPGRCQLVFH